MKFRALRLAAWTSTFAAAAYLRLTGVFASIVRDEFVANGPGTSYHVRRMLQTWEHYPNAPRFDPLLAWPHGAASPWPQGFDVLVATIALPASDRFEALFLISLAPVLLALALIALAGWSVRALAPDAPWWTPWLASTLVAIFPQSVSVTRFANPDHHIAEALIMLGLGMWSVAIWRALTASTLSSRRRFAIEAAGTALLICSHTNHIGTPAYVWIVGASICIANLRWGHGHPARWAVGAPALIAGSAVAAVVFLPLIQVHGHMLSYVFPSLLQPLLVIVAGVGCALASLLGWTLIGSQRRRAWGLVALVTIACGALLVPGLRAASEELLFGMREWFGDRDFLAKISENLPLFAGDPPWARAYSYYGAFGPLLPLLVPLGLVVHARRVGMRDAIPFVVWTACITVLMLQQNRFGRIGLVNLAICSALVLTALVDAAPRLRPLAIAVPLLAMLLDPAFHFYVRPEPEGPLPGLPEAGVFLRNHTPAPVVGKRSGVLVPWDQSHYIVRYGERPVTATGFGYYVDPEAADEVIHIWERTEARLERFANARDLGFVASSAATFTGRTLHGRGPLIRDERRGFRWNAEYFQRVPLATLLLGGSGIRDAGVEHLRHLMPRFASTLPASGLPLIVPDTWVYQFVAGAVVSGHASANATVRLQTPITRPQGRFIHEAWTKAGPDGTFTLTTPVPTGYTGAGFATGPNAVLLTGEGDPHMLTIAEHAVRAGEALSIDPPAPAQPPQ